MHSTWKVFIPNTKDNPFSLIIDYFLHRQLYLDANNTVIMQLKNEADVSFSHIFTDINGFQVLHYHTYETTSTDTVEQDYFMNYLRMNLLSQSVENFETFLKKFIDELGTIKNIVPHALRTNKDRIKFIKDNCSEVNQQMTTKRYKEVYESFLLIEQIRHITVHSKMTINPNSKINRSRKEFKTYFNIKKKLNEEYVIVSLQGAQQYIARISDLAYMMFQAVSKEQNYPIKTVEI